MLASFQAVQGTGDLRFVINRLPKLAEREIPEHPVTVIVQNPQIVGLVQVLHDDLEVFAVLFLDVVDHHS